MNTGTFHTEKIPVGAEFTIVQISDLHNKVFDQNNEKLIQAFRNVDPDIIVITGDFIDRNTYNFKSVFSLTERITAFHPEVFFVSGNHEWGNPGYEHLFQGLQQRNVRILNNQHIKIITKQMEINLAGIDDASTEHEDMEKTFSGLEEELYTILLSHSPSTIKKYPDIPADLILSGHTHGGQVRLPLIGAVVAPGQGLFPKFDKGVFEIGENRYLYIDSGLGTSLAPVRFLNKSQFSLIRVRNENQ
ncbi:metallophosphoesterase [Virgibacillus kimchii]